MWRFLAGAGSALLLTGAGFIWWSSGRQATPLLSAVAPPLARSTSGADAAPPEAEERTREQKRFDRYDKDRDELVSAEEYLANRRKAFARLDTDHDGRLGFEEWAKKTTDKFAGADADKSKGLTRTEFATTRVVRKTRPKPNCPPPAQEDDEG
jgi:hypothetical protein